MLDRPLPRQATGDRRGADTGPGALRQKPRRAMSAEWACAARDSRELDVSARHPRLARSLFTSAMTCAAVPPAAGAAGVFEPAGADGRRLVRGAGIIRAISGMTDGDLRTSGPLRPDADRSDRDI
ncbi:hypothetical protein SM611_09065 [Actinomadura sp. DLS-62]|uniref:Uncharacterized protein n=1 Tax=Actinomadura monticuli TaxID=3097367 RepID=A0ABV4Q7L9_9ACTN